MNFWFHNCNFEHNTSVDRDSMTVLQSTESDWMHIKFVHFCQVILDNKSPIQTSPHWWKVNIEKNNMSVVLEFPVIDLQAFRHKNKPIKELLGRGQHNNHTILIQAPNRISYLANENKKTYFWRTKILHDILWNVGTYDYSFSFSLLIALKNRFPNTRLNAWEVTFAKSWMAQREGFQPSFEY